MIENDFYATGELGPTLPPADHWHRGEFATVLIGLAIVLWLMALPTRPESEARQYCLSTQMANGSLVWTPGVGCEYRPNE